ncbi:MAG: DEAD/DEAH box helicase [Phycisphaerae bacterium]|nr:DEAD/DEAH box helicase [Phycisphaerae bacterium]
MAAPVPNTPHQTHTTARPSASTAPAFDDLGLVDPLRRALRDDGYETPTPIQAQSIPALLAGRDMLGCAQTGTGKTAAFALPILQRLHASPRRGTQPRALVLAPTRELAVQIAESFRSYGKHTKVSGTTLFGGVSQFHQVKALRRGVDVIVATPGRLLDLMEQGFVDLSSIEVFVLDEADRMLDMGFIKPIQRIAAAVPARRQTLLFSATMPQEIVHLAEALLSDPARVAVTPVASAAPKIEQSVHLVPNAGKFALLETLLKHESVERALVFVRTKHGADRLSRKLESSGLRAGAIHGNKAQNARQRALEAFRNGRMPILVATDVAARGIDVDDVSHVFNFDLPFEPEAYVHRIGRTGRAGAVGTAVAFCDRDERGMLRAIERLLGTSIPRADGSDESHEDDHAGEPARRGSGGPNGSHRGAKQGAGRGRGGAPGRGPGASSKRSPKRGHDRGFDPRGAKPHANRPAPHGASERGGERGGEDRTGAPGRRVGTHAAHTPSTPNFRMTRGWHKPTKRR